MSGALRRCAICLIQRQEFELRSHKSYKKADLTMLQGSIMLIENQQDHVRRAPEVRYLLVNPEARI